MHYGETKTEEMSVSYGLAGYAVEILAPFFTGLILYVVSEAQRSRQPRAKIITMMRICNKQIDDFFVNLNGFAVMAFIPVVFLIFVTIVMTILGLLSLYTPIMAFAGAAAITAFQLLIVKDPKNFSKAKFNYRKLSFYYGTRKFYWVILVAAYASLYVTQFLSIYIDHAYLSGGFVPSHLGSGEVLADAFVLPIAAVVALYVVNFTFEAIYRPKMTRSIYRPDPISTEKSGDTAEHKKMVKDFRTIDGLEDLIFSVTQKPPHLDFIVNGKTYSGIVVGLGGSLSIMRGSTMTHIDWSKVDAVISR